MTLKKILLLLVYHCLLLTAYCQPNYWQQQVNYTINVSLNDQDHTLKGFIDMEYINNSPDKLDFIWFHLWPNAYKNNKTAFAAQLFHDKDGKNSWKKMTDNGYIDSLNFTVNSEKAELIPDPVNIDIVKLVLPKSLQPGGKINVSTPFFVKLPTFISRSGYDGQSYMVCQWYPKPAVYDRKGWHAFPYLDQGEFYSEFGNFNVNITVPPAYVVGATGMLQNIDELNTYKEIGRANHNRTKDNKPVNYTPSEDKKIKTLNYTADNVHDFAWFADKSFIIEYDSLPMPSGTIVDVFSYHRPGGNRLWNKSTDYIKDAVIHYSNWIGEYPYPTVAAVEGPATKSAGGMEYPMITLITSPDADEENLDATITHEVGHNWFYSLLGSNERDHPWMDEGINTYFQFRYEAEKYKSNSIFGKSIPKEIQNLPVDDFLAQVYSVLGKIPMDPKIETPSTGFRNMEEYGLVIYMKTAIWLYKAETMIGKVLLQIAFRSYFNEWKYRHPYPEDVKASFEKTLRRNLDDLFSLLNKKGTLE